MHFFRTAAQRITHSHSLIRSDSLHRSKLLLSHGLAPLAKLSPPAASDPSAEKNLRLCRVDAFENPLLSVGASSSGFGSHCKGGLASAKLINGRLPAGTPSVRQKDRQFTNTAEVFEAVADFANYSSKSLGRSQVIPRRSHVPERALCALRDFGHLPSSTLLKSRRSRAMPYFY